MSIVDTRLQDMRVKSNNFDSNENRGSEYGALEVFLNQTKMAGGIATAELVKKAQRSVGSSLQIPVFKNKEVTIGNQRSITIAADENTTALYTVTFETWTYGFHMYPTSYHNNEFKYQEDWEEKVNAFIVKLGKTLDTACLAKLSAAKSQVITDPLNYTVTANTIVAPWAQRDNLMGDIDPIMNSNDHYGQLHVVGNMGVKSVLNKLAQSDIYNAVNKRNEYAGKVFYFTNRLGNGVGEFANMYAIQEGSLAALPRFSREELVNAKMQDGTEWGIGTLPELNIPIGTFYQEAKGDYSAVAGAATADMKASYRHEYGFAIDFAFVTPYNSDLTTIANPIVKATIQST